MAKSRVIDRDMGYKAFADKMKRASRGDPHVTVGVHGKDGARGAGEPTNVEVATFNEFGTTTVPERSFLRSTMDEQRPKYARMLDRVIGRWVDGKLSLADGFGLVGLQAKADVQRKIVKLRDPPNADSTIARKGSSNPLIDTGQMLNAIDFAVHLPPGLK